MIAKDFTKFLEGVEYKDNYSLHTLLLRGKQLDSCKVSVAYTADYNTALYNTTLLTTILRT